VLRGPKKKKVKTPTDCYDMCAAKSSCMRWNHKMSKKVAKRLCMLMSVTYAKKKGFTSGERVESCGTGPIAMTETILENTMSVLKNIQVIKKVKNANICSEKCSLSNDCQYYKWMAKKKMCYLMKLSTKNKKGMSTS